MILTNKKALFDETTDNQISGSLTDFKITVKHFLEFFISKDAHSIYLVYCSTSYIDFLCGYHIVNFM